MGRKLKTEIVNVIYSRHLKRNVNFEKVLETSTAKFKGNCVNRNIKRHLKLVVQWTFQNRNLRVASSSEVKREI